MVDPENRRPLASRDTRIARALTRRLAATSVTPNQISMASIAAAALSGITFALAGPLEGGFLRGMLLILAAIFCQLRLLCNLLDGLVAVEAGKASADGGFWNDFPDRIADLMIVLGIGYGIGEPTLGWAAGVFALFTAYQRLLGQSLGMAADFTGPMAKQHRMALITAAAIVALLAPLWGWHNQPLHFALWMVVLGGAVTVLRRAMRLLNALNR